MSRQRDLIQAHNDLVDACDELIKCGVPIETDMFQLQAYYDVATALKLLRGVQDSQRADHAAVARDTSIRAAKSIQTGGQSHGVLDLIVERWTDSGGQDGLTADQIEYMWPKRFKDKNGKPATGRHQSLSARVSELERDGYIYDSKRRRETRSGHLAIVWLPTGRGVARIGER